MPRKKKKEVNRVAELRSKMSEAYRQTVLDLLDALRREALCNALPFRKVPQYESLKWVNNQGRYWQTVASAMKWAQDRVSPENRTGRPKRCQEENLGHSVCSSSRMASTGLLTLSQEEQEPSVSSRDSVKRTRRPHRAS